MAAARRKPTGAAKKLNSHLWKRHPDDWYVEPTWVDERLFAVEKFEGGILDPACGMGRIVHAAWAAGLDAVGSDLHQRAEGMMYALDFLTPHYPREIMMPVAGGRLLNIASNPPFKHAEMFLRVALHMASNKVALLLPSDWLADDVRSRWVEETPLYRIYQLTPRPSMPPGPVIEAGIKPGSGRRNFSWFIWQLGFRGVPTFHWLRRDG